GQRAWVETGGALSVNSKVQQYPTKVSARAAALLAGADHFRFDASDQMPPTLSAAFNHAVLDFAENPRRLPQILADLEAARVVAYGG
ncbi:MAG TPA: hypothetical protein VFS32_01950, partial [Candidatus Limnocylindrales bacterium]|nr:hypothetical protein [Candidatus Limnocylindrales bacterium]